jgi:3-phytase
VNRGLLFAAAGFVIVCGLASCKPFATGALTVEPAVTCLDARARDQDDLCIWVHPSDAAQSVIITSDKKADKIFVYDLQGKTLQVFTARKPGNIDVRYGFALGNRKVDIVAWNQRGTDASIVVCSVNPLTRQLERIDHDTIRTDSAYGGTLYHSARSGKFYFITTAKSGAVVQYELADDGTGRVGGVKVRQLRIGAGEAAVADDEQGLLYIAEERGGVWEVGAEPGDTAPGKLVVRAGDNGLQPDVEGLAICRTGKAQGYLIASSQGNSTFKVYERTGEHRFVGTFAVHDTRQTDGIEVSAVDFGGPFHKGLFVCHNGAIEERCPVLLVAWESIAKGLPRAAEPQADRQR